MISQLIINTLTGAGTGYITNNIAIKMLFKKYFGRFGGIIEDTHDEFVENISNLIEKDLINHHTLDDEFNSAEFHKYIKDLTEDMFVHSLIKNSVGLKDINGIYETIDNIVNFLQSNKHIQSKLIDKIASKQLSSALSYTQVSHISRHVQNILSENKSKYLDDLVRPIKKIKIDSLLSNNLLEELVKNINTIIMNVDISEFDEKIDSSILDLLEVIKIDEIISFTKNEIENIYFKDIFSDSNESTKDFISRMVEIALSDEGQMAISQSVKAILISLSEVKISILSLFDDEIKESIKSFVVNELPKIITRIIEFMDQNEKDLEILINDSIDEALEGGIFPEFKKKIVSTFYTNIVVDFEVLTMIKEYIDEYREYAQDEIVELILDILENKAIGDLYQEFVKRELITPDKVVDLIVNNLKEFNVNRKINIIETVLNKQVKEYTEVDLSFVKSRLIPHAISKVKNYYIYSSKIKDVISKEIKKTIEEFKSKTVDEVLGTRVDILISKVSDSIDSDELLSMILSSANKLLDKPINEIIDGDTIEIDYKRYIVQMVDNKSLKDIIIHLQNEEVYEALKNALIHVLIDNLEDILRGNVSEAVKKELVKLTPAQIKNMVEEFMGEELKPINYFGAVLGGVAGAGVGILSIPVWANPFIYGVVGVATNYLAIKMLFQPYTPLKIGKFKIPFSEGVLPGNKDKMSVKMSEFVDEFMLNGTSIHNFFQNNSASLKSFIKDHVAQDDYSIIDKLIHQKSNISDVSNEALNLVFNFLDNNQKMIIDKIFDISMAFYDKKEDYTKEVSEFAFSQIMKTDLSDFLYEQFDKFVDKDSSLEFLAKDLFAEFDKFVEKSFKEFTNLLSDMGEIKKIVLNFSDEFDEYINNKSLLDMMDISVKEKLTQTVNKSLINLFYGEDIINEVLTFFTKGEFNSKSKLSDMINGLLPKIIENNLHMIIDETIIPALQEHKPLIKSEIMKKVPFGMGWIAQRDVKRAMNIIIDERIPEFMEEKINGINEIVQEVLNNQLGDFGYNEDVINQKKVDELMKTILSNENFEASFSTSMDVFVDTVFNMRLKTILKIFNIKDISDIYKVLEPNMKKVLELLKENVSQVESESLQIINNLAKDEIAISILQNTTINDLMGNIDKEFLIKEFGLLQTNIKLLPEFENILRKVIQNFISIFIKKDFLQKDVFKDDLDSFIKEIIKDKEKLRPILVAFLEEFIMNINNILDIKLKDNMLEIIVNSAFDSIDKKIMDLIGAIDFKKVITKEIQEMHPKELEDMFYSFAGPYFNKLILYGAIGFFFGLVTII